MCILVLGISALLVRARLTGYNAALARNWGISIPSKAHFSEIYSKSSGSSFHGDGIRYHVFTYQDPSCISQMLDWESEEKETLFYGPYSHAVDVWLDAIEVPAEYRPACSDCLFWYASQDANSEILILWDKENRTLHLVESFL